MRLLASFSTFRLIAYSSPVKSLIFAFVALRRVNFAIFAWVMLAPAFLPSAFLNAAWRLGSGIFTVDAVAKGGIETKIKRNSVKKYRFIIVSLCLYLMRTPKGIPRLGLWRFGSPNTFSGVGPLKRQVNQHDPL